MPNDDNKQGDREHTGRVDFDKAGNPFERTNGPGTNDDGKGAMGPDAAERLDKTQR